MNSENALFSGLLGPAVATLDAPLQRVHRGDSGVYRGWATVERGSGWLARLGRRLAGLPRNTHTQDLPLRFELHAGAHRETWTRRFEGSPATRSRLEADAGQLVERLGPAVVRFALRFDMRAHVHGADGLYHFAIEARFRGAGRLIRYEGVLYVH